MPADDGAITVLLCDDHASIRSGLRLLLENVGFDVVGEACDGADAVAAAERLRPMVTLMDIRMPGTDGISATTSIVQGGLSRVLILTTFEIDDYIVGALQAGADGYLLKTATAEQLSSAIRSVAAGDAALAPSVTRAVIAHIASLGPATVTREIAPLPDDLTDREREVLMCLGRGLSNAEIGRELYIGEATVKTHVSRVLTKLALSSRVQAAIYVRDHGLVD